MLAALLREASQKVSWSNHRWFRPKPQLLLRRGAPLLRVGATSFRLLRGEIITFAARRVLLLVILYTTELPVIKPLLQFGHKKAHTEGQCS